MFLDIGVGIILALGLHQPIWLGIALALLPDIDFLIELFRHGSVGGTVVREHRELLHFPLIYVPVAIVLFIFAPLNVALLFSLALLIHFLHDSSGLGWGVAWLWPFSKRSYKAFSKHDSAFSWKDFTSWSPEEMVRVAAEHGDPHWIKNFYLRFTPTLITELIVLAVALTAWWFATH